MALHVRVMPLTRYLCGGARDDAGAVRRRVQILQSLVTRKAGRPIAWRDEGETLLDEELPAEAWDALRAFAADRGSAAAGSAAGAAGRAYPLLEQVRRGQHALHPHLVRGDARRAVYVPCDFPEPLSADEEQLSIGSSVGLLRELNILAGPLRMRLDQGEPGWTDQFERADALELPRMAWALLRWCARLSVQHRLPVIIGG